MNHPRRPGLAPALLALAGMLVALAGCGSTPATLTPAPAPSGEVSSGMLVPADVARMLLADNQVFIHGELVNPEVMPAYPPALLHRRLPEQTVCIRFVVEANGAVRDPAPLHGVEGCPADPATVPPGFTEAALEAVRQWDFFSFLRCTFPPGTPDTQKCNGPGAKAEQVAVSLAYRFVFSVRDGKGSVESQPANPR